MAVASGAATVERGGGGCSSMVSIVVAPAAMVGATRAAAAAVASSAVVVAAVVMVVVWCVLPRSIGHTAKRASVNGSGVITDRLYDKRGLSGSVWRLARPFGGRAWQGGAAGREDGGSTNHDAEKARTFGNEWRAPLPRAAASPSASRESAIGWVCGRPRAT